MGGIYLPKYLAEEKYLLAKPKLHAHVNATLSLLSSVVIRALQQMHLFVAAFYLLLLCHKMEM